MPQLLGSSTLTGSAASITVTIPAGFNHLQGIWTGRSDAVATAASLQLRFNGDNGSNYLWQQLEANNASSSASSSGGATTAARIGAVPAASASADYWGSGSFTVGGIAAAASFKVAVGGSSAFVTTTNSYVGTYSGQWNSLSTITSVSLLAASGNLVTGSSLSIYGWE